MRFIHKLKFVYRLLFTQRSNSFIEFMLFLKRIDALEIFYFGGPDNLLQITGVVEDYHWYLLMRQKDNEFIDQMKVVFPKDKNQDTFTSRYICLQISVDAFNYKEIEVFKRLVYSLHHNSTNIYPRDHSSLDVAENVARYLYRLEDNRMCTYTFK